MLDLLKKKLKQYVPIEWVNYAKRYLIYFPFEVASKENGKTIHHFHFNKREKESICIFSHFDKENMIDDYVVYYLHRLLEQGFDIVFVSTSEKLTMQEVEKISPYCCDVIVKENIGYDFGAWQTGICYLDDELDSYQSLLLCNDSVYAPLYPLDEMFENMQGKYDFWGITDSHEIYHHLQSYFMVFDQKVFRKKLFKDIWQKYKIYHIKRNIILQYEIGISRKLLGAGFTMGAYCPFSKLGARKMKNASHYHWKELIEKHRCPILKVELLRDNPRKIDIYDWDLVIKACCDYDTDLIKNHLDRVQKKPLGLSYHDAQSK